MATQRGKGKQESTSLLDGIRNSPATERLLDQGRSFVDDKFGALTDRLGDVGNGELPILGKAAKGMASGKGPGRSMLSAVTSGVADKAKGLVGKGDDSDEQSGKGGGKGPSKAMNIEESIDVGVPVSVAYNQWTQFEDFSQFTKGVESVEQKDDTELVWRAKVFKSHRSWNAKIVEQIPDKRIVWTSEGKKGSTRGVVTFHPLGDELTRVLLAIEYYPQGAVERIGNLWRAAGRRARLDLKNFRRFVMLENEATGAWRGEIHDGKATKPGQSRRPAKKSAARPPEKRAQKSAQKSPQKSAQKPAAKSGEDSGQKSGGSSAPRNAAKSTPRKATKSARSTPAKATKSSRPAAKSEPAKRQPARKQAPAKRQARKQAPAKRTAAKASSRSRSRGSGG